MQRGGFAPMPANSPPLHHPVPQHVSTVPQLRSPPPAAPHSAQGGYGNPYQPAANAFGAYGNFLNDPATTMGLQMSQTALKHGSEYVEQNLGRFISVSSLKHYFNVSNSYVVNKLWVVLFPWRHRPWSRQQSMASGNGQTFAPPRDDINSPDMYIPVMAIVTYILLSTLIAGIRGEFQPELLGFTASTAVFICAVEIAGLKLGCYLLSISNESQLLDLIAYSGYKFLGVILTLVVSEIISGGKGFGGYISWTVFIYLFLANAFFLLRSLKYVLLPEPTDSARGAMQTVARSQRNRRTQFLFLYSYVVQFIFMWALTRS